MHFFNDKTSWRKVTLRAESHLGMATSRAQRWYLQGRRERISSPQKGGGEAWRVGTGRTQQPLDPSLSCRVLVFVGEKMNTLPQGITLSTSQVGKLRQHMSDCDSGEIVLEVRGDMCDHDEPSGQQKPLQVGPVLAQVLGTFLSIPGSIAALLWALGSSCVLLSHHPHGKLGW